MLYRSKVVAAMMSALLLVTGAAVAGDSKEDIKQRIGSGDPVAGKEKSASCQGCHGEKGESSAPNFPRLDGQYADYLKRQIMDFKSEKRTDAMMSGMVAGLEDPQDIADIAAYFASQMQMKAAAATKNEAGQKLYNEGRLAGGVYGCINCHGVNGKGLAPNNSLFPVIGGQNKDYLVKTLTDFRDGNRKNDSGGMMANIAKPLSDEEIQAVSDYLSGL